MKTYYSIFVVCVITEHNTKVAEEFTRREVLVPLLKSFDGQNEIYKEMGEPQIPQFPNEVEAYIWYKDFAEKFKQKQIAHNEESKKHKYMYPNYSELPKKFQLIKTIEIL